MGAPFTPEEAPGGSEPPFDDLSSDTWTPLYHHACAFGPDLFISKMMNLIKNPNINSSWLFRADIVYDDEDSAPTPGSHGSVAPVVREFRGFDRKRTLVRRLIPRNERRDAQLEQTCTFHQFSPTESSVSSLVIYNPHVTSATELPFYHPKVESIAHLHEWDSATNTGRVSIHFLPYPEHPIHEDKKLQRTAFHLLEVIHKHGTGSMGGYVKKVNHDQVITQQQFQDRYALLKNKYARRLVESWAESTNPVKHVFEDLGIAAFLLELWADMYKDTEFPGFVDIGCGNGLLVYILREEGFSGWGFDARDRKSWAQYRTDSSASPSGSSLEQRLLLPSIVSNATADEGAEAIQASALHDGTFPKGTFIISNHADELTPWTPLLATISQCPFIMIPCCSHSLAGDRYRAPPPRDRSKSRSTYASLVDWVARIAEDCGWRVETEMLRIPSSRNTCLLGRTRTADAAEVDVAAVVQKYGGVGNYHATVAKLLKAAPKGH